MRYVSSWRSSYCTCSYCACRYCTCSYCTDSYCTCYSTGSFHPAKLCSSLKQVFLLTHLTARHGLLNFAKARSWGWCRESRWPWNSKVSFFFKISSCDSNTAIFWCSLRSSKKERLSGDCVRPRPHIGKYSYGLPDFHYMQCRSSWQNKLECYCELRENRWSISHILCACINEFLTKFLFCLAVYDEIRYRRSSCFVVEQLWVLLKLVHKMAYIT